METFIKMTESHKGEDISCKNTNREIFRYVIPSVIGMMGIFAYYVVDGVFVGTGVGSDALAAVNLAVPYTEIVTALSSMLSVGGASVMAIRKGRGDEKGANNAFLTSVFLVMAEGIILTVLGVVFPGRIAILLGASVLLTEPTACYIRWYCLFSVFMIMSALGGIYIRNDGSPEIAFYGMIAGALSNIFLDWLFVFPMRMGIKGAAIASGLGQFVSCMVLSIHFIRKKGVLRFRKYMPSLEMMCKVWTRGLPEFAVQLSWPVTMYCYNRVILDYLGEKGLSAFAACNYMLMLIFGAFLGVSQGIQPLIGNSYGARKKKNLEYLFHAALIISFCLTAFLYIVYIVFGAQLLHLFLTETELIPTAYASMKYYGLSMLPASLNVIFIMYFLSVKKTERSMVISCGRGMVLNSFCIFFIPHLCGVAFIWSSMIVAEGLTLLIGIFLKRQSCCGL